MTVDGGHRTVGLSEAVPLFFKNYVNFNDRSSRGAYWWWIVASVVIRVALLTLEKSLFGADANDLAGVGPLTVLFLLATIVPEISIGARRPHDTSKSALWLLVGVIPVLGWLVLIWFLAQPGVRATNAFGPDVEAGRDVQR